MDLSDESLVNFLKDARYGTKDLESYQKYMEENAKSTSTFASVSTSASTALKSLGAGLASMAINYVISEAIGLAITGLQDLYNEIYHAYDLAMEALDESTEKLESVQSEISDLEGQIKDLNESKTDVTDEENGKEIGTPDMLLSDMPAYNLNLHH
jgi:hypothetical protein